MHTLLLGKIGQGITQDSGQEPRAKTFWGIFDLGMAAYRLRSRPF